MDVLEFANIPLLQNLNVLLLDSSHVCHLIGHFDKGWSWTLPDLISIVSLRHLGCIKRWFLMGCLHQRGLEV